MWRLSELLPLQASESALMSLGGQSMVNMLSTNGIHCFKYIKESRSVR